MNTDPGFKRVVHHLSICGLHPVPEEKAITEFVNSGAADKYKIDWNQFKTHYADTETQELMDCAVELVDAYMQWWVDKQVKEERKANIQNLKKEFSDTTKYKVIEEIGKWMFVAPLSYEACVYMDSYKCGGAGAKWCIGFEKSNEYWYEYTGAKQKFFILALNLENWGSENALKYMIEIGQNSGKFYQAWTQDDDVERTIKSAEEFNTRILKDVVDINDIIAVAKEDTVKRLQSALVRLESIYLDGKRSWTAASDTIYLLPMEQDDEIYLEDIYLKCTNKEKIKEFVIRGTAEKNSFDNLKDSTPCSKLMLSKLLIYSSESYQSQVVLPPLRLENFESVDIQECYIDYSKQVLGQAILGIVPIDIEHLIVYDDQMMQGEDYMSEEYYLENELFSSETFIRDFKVSPFGNFKDDKLRKNKCNDASWYMNAFSDMTSAFSPGDYITLDFSDKPHWGSFDLTKGFLKDVEQNFEDGEYSISTIRIINANLQELIVPFELVKYNIELHFINSQVDELKLVEKIDEANVYGDYSRKDSNVLD